MNISETVKAAMNDKGITRAVLAKKTGYSYQYIYDLLAGQRRWHEEPINRVFKVLGIQVSFNVEAEEKDGGNESDCKSVSVSGHEHTDNC